MAELFNPNDIDIRSLTVETPAPETRPTFNLEKYVTEADWEQIFEFAEGEAEYTDGLFYGGLKTVSPERFKRVAARANEAYYREESARFKRRNELLRLRGYVPPEMLAEPFVDRINHQLLFPEFVAFDVPEWLINRTKSNASDAAALRKDLNSALFSDKLAPEESRSFTLPDSYWETVLPRAVQTMKMKVVDNNLVRVGPSDDVGTWGIAAMRLYDEACFRRFTAEIPSYTEGVGHELQNIRFARSWNELFEWAFLAKIIAAHSVSVGPNGLEIQDSPPPSVDNDASILPEQRRY